jgi:hypothetical protein
LSLKFPFAQAGVPVKKGGSSCRAGDDVRTNSSTLPRALALSTATPANWAGIMVITGHESLFALSWLKLLIKAEVQFKQLLFKNACQISQEESVKLRYSNLEVDQILPEEWW